MKGRQSAIHRLEVEAVADLTTKFSCTNRTLCSLYADWFYFLLAAGGAADCPQEFQLYFFFFMNFARSFCLKCFVLFAVTLKMHISSTMSSLSHRLESKKQGNFTHQPKVVHFTHYLCFVILKTKNMLMYVFVFVLFFCSLSIFEDFLENWSKYAHTDNMALHRLMCGHFILAHCNEKAVLLNVINSILMKLQHHCRGMLHTPKHILY